MPTPPAAEVRRIVLSSVLGASVRGDDPALALAAGVDERWPVEDTADDLLAAVGHWAQTLADHPMLGWQHPDDAAWFAGVDPVVAVVANALLRRFAAHLTGFGRAPAGYLVERVIPPGGTVVWADDAIHAELPMVPLQIVLAMAGLDTFVARPRWLDRPITVSHSGGV